MTTNLNLIGQFCQQLTRCLYKQISTYICSTSWFTGGYKDCWSNVGVMPSRTMSRLQLQVTILLLEGLKYLNQYCCTGLGCLNISV